MAGTRTRKKADGPSPSPAAPAAKPAPAPAARPAELQQKIATTAYYLWERRGRPHGTSARDWLDAERIVLGGKS